MSTDCGQMAIRRTGGDLLIQGLLKVLKYGKPIPLAPFPYYFIKGRGNKIREGALPPL
jgi:hypothetical protein